jgi:hypothetical protein
VAESLKRQVRNYYYTFRSSSWQAVVANGLNIVSQLYQWVFAGLLGMKPEIALGSSMVLFFLASVIYSAAHGLFMPLNSTLSSRWSEHEAKTANYLAYSIEQIRNASSPVSLAAVDHQKFLHGILSAIRNEVETWVVESAGLYINVSLLVEDPKDSSRLMVIARALPDRLNVSYAKENLFAWRFCWRLKRVHYVRDFSDPSKPYKSILLVPIKIEADNGNTQVVGVISIDSSKKSHFEGFEDEIERKLLTELSLLKLVLG